jgi:hypothetical protein
LLDTPEHLWRLIERKNYLHAAWLFLLSRVAHRTLTTHDEDEQSWAEEGLEVEVSQIALILQLIITLALDGLSTSATAVGGCGAV